MGFNFFYFYFFINPDFFQESLNDKIRILENEIKTTSTSLHTYYESQMEAIFLEKVSAIQKNVSEWEKRFAEEKIRDLERVKQQHQQHVEKILQE